MKNTSLLKLISILSCILGAICGFLSLLPYVGGLVFFVLMCLASIIIMIFLMRAKLLNLESTPESITIGAIIGFVSFIAFSVVYMPLVLFFMKVFHYYTNYGVALSLSNANLFIIMVVTIFMGILSATINAFTGFLLFYITEIFKNMNNKQ